MRPIVVLALAAQLAALAAQPVKVWQGVLPLPVSEEGLPDPNPPFDAFATSRFNYPYTLRTTMTGRRVERNLRAVFLENEYLKCSVLPDIGGHLYSCTDKTNGREMFYANPSLKKQLIGYRGAWAAFGIEFNFPVSHNWMSMSPVDFAWRANADGSASVFVGNIDRPYSTEWSVELVLRPASMLLEEKITLHNRGDVRRRYYWWNNAAAEVGDDSKIYYPMRYSASHGFTTVDTWPVNQAGLDLSIVRNHTAGPVSQFVHGSREPFMGVWHPRWNAGVVHWSDWSVLPAKKIWSFGVDADGLDWRRALSDNNSGYVEIQAGLYRNQETYAFLEPQSTIRFSEYWMPVREIGGISRANLDGVVFLRRNGTKLQAGLNVNRPIADARITVRDGARTLADARESLTPEKSWMRTIDAPAGKCTFELRDAAGKLLLAHTEDTYDWTPSSEIRLGRQPAPPKGTALEQGADAELNGKLLAARDIYKDALKADANNRDLHRAAGRLAATMKDYEGAIAHLKRAGNDADSSYYLGIALAATGNDAAARAAFERAMPKDAARLQMALIDARAGRRGDALAALAALDTPRARLSAISLLRASGKQDDARRRAEVLYRALPTSNTLRIERVKLGASDDALWRHLGSDAERVMEAAADYMNLGLYGDALELLSRQYPPHDADEAEPGAPLPQDYPLTAYYRGLCREKLGESGKADFQAAAKLSPRWVFPYRTTTLAALRAAVAANPDDAMANFYLGNLWMSAGLTDRAIDAWQRARRAKKDIPTLHRNLGRTLFALLHQDNAAAEVLREGLDADPRNVEVYVWLTSAMSILGRPAAERVAVLERYPDRAAMPTSLAVDLALSYAEAGRFDDARAMFRNRHFEKEEGGVDVRRVYMEVQFRQAITLARKGQKAAAREIVQNLAKPVEGLEFTRSGMEAQLRGPRYDALRRQVEGDAPARFRGTRQEQMDRLRAPDRGLAHYMARTALAEGVR